MFSSDAVLERAAELKARGVPFVLATVVRCDSPTSAKPGAKGIVDAAGQISGWIGGGCAQPAVVSAAMKALADGQARLIRVGPAKAGSVEEGILDFRMSCHSGGTLDIFLEPSHCVPACSSSVRRPLRRCSACSPSRLDSMFSPLRQARTPGCSQGHGKCSMEWTSPV
jgi:xanthine dehydrogenase accessory factor